MCIYKIWRWENKKFKKYYIKVTANRLNVREKPNANNDTKIIRVLKKGEKWLIRDEKNGWGKIRIGWIKLSYTKKVWQNLKINV